MNDYKLVVFDWDGTLMDSISRIVASIQAAAEFCHQDIPTVRQVKDIIGLSLPKAFEILFPVACADKLIDLREHYKYQYLECNTTPAPLFGDTLSLLKALQTNEKLIAVATGKARAGLDRVLDETQTTEYFHATRCADETLSKPAPQMLLSLLSELNVSPEQAIMIGDSSFDLEMAQSAGVDSIGVTLGVHDRAILSQYAPVAIVDSLSELEPFLINE